MNKKNKGFTLVEIALVLSIATIIGFVTFSQFLKQTEFKQARFAGEQIKLIGNATDAYISNHYDKLSSLTDSTGDTDDIGSRICSSSTNNCSITIKTLVNEGLLPSTFSGINIYGFGYNIILKRSGVAPYYKIHGIVVTDKTLTIGNRIRYDLLGESMQAAGIDSGMTQNSSSQISGFNGSWSANSSDYNNINKLGQLAYQTGYGTYNYSVFLRRDGTLPMTGDLNMGNNNIINAKNITASGITTSGTLKSTGETNVGTDLTVSKNTVVGGTGSFGGNIASGGLSTTDFPSGYLGGMISNDYYAQAGIYIAKNGSSITDKKWAFQATRDGYLGISGNMVASGTISSGGDIYSGHEVLAKNGSGDRMWLGGSDGNGDYEIRLDTEEPLTIWQTPNKSRKDITLGVWGSQSIDGNLKVSSSSDADGSIIASGNITSSSTVSGNYLLSNSNVTSGDSCSTNGLISKTTEGVLLTCINGAWQQPYKPTVTLRDDGKWGSDDDTQYCNSDEYIIGGGGECQDPAHHFIHFSAPSGNNGWTVNCFYTDPSYKDLPAKAYALCLKK